MYTVFVLKTKDETVKHHVETQQYVVGTYICVTDVKTKRYVAQYTAYDTEEEDFHKKFRVKVLKAGGTLIEGTVIPYKGKKYKINEFKQV